jgi:glycosyltransferase involved in cell wall biosynthesis
LEQLIADLGLAERVRLLGFLPERTLPSYYQAADLVLMPTFEMEGFGLVTVEALACGTPVLGAPVGAIPEILTRVDPILLADGTDSAALAKGIRRLLRRFRDRPAEQRRVSQRGRELVEADYNWARHCERLEAVLLDVKGEA